MNLLGQVALETNTARVNERLVERGLPPVCGFHHEVRTLPNGRIVTLDSIERLLTDVQGQGTVDVIGDMTIVFNSDLQVLWTWSTFDHLDARRMAVSKLGGTPSAGGCPPFYLAPHCNAIRLTSAGNLLFSARHQDWLIKISIDGGEGDGHIMWKLFKDGDFTFAGSEVYPWFTREHDGNFISSIRLTVFGNGNTRFVENDDSGNSRGQLRQLDEENRTAKLSLNADIGVYAPAVRSAQRHQIGNFAFHVGFVPAPTGLTSYSIEVNPEGKTVSSIRGNSLLYRAFRLADPYSIN